MYYRKLAEETRVQRLHLPLILIQNVFYQARIVYAVKNASDFIKLVNFIYISIFVPLVLKVKLAKFHQDRDKIADL